MSNQKLTKRTVDAAKPAASMYELRDSELTGFGVRIWPSGTKTYFYSYRMPKRFGGRQGFVTIGDHGSPWTVELARKDAEGLAHAAKVRGVDPQIHRKGEEKDAVELAFNRVAELFIEKYLPINWPRFQAEGARLLRREVVPHFGSQPLPGITKRQVADFLDTLTDRPGIAKNTSTVLRKLFNWASIGRGFIPVSPMLGMDLPNGPEARKRRLRDGELSALWAATKTIDHPYAALVRTLILLGQRRDETADMDRVEIDFSYGLWTIPGARTKNGKDHIVPLSSLAMSEISASLHPGWIFSVSGDRPIQNWSYWKRKVDTAFALVCEERKLPAPEPWTLHDLRRSVASGMQELRINRDLIEVIQNRELPGENARRYQVHDFLDEKRVALATWDRHISEITTTVTADAVPTADAA